MRKRFIALILLLCMVAGAFSANAAETAATEEVKMNFTDVGESHPAYSAILYLFENGIINGKSENLFYPDDFLKREEFAKILVKSLETTKTDGAPIFKDVPAGAWYADYVRSAAAAKVMTGISDTEFGVGYTLTRQDLAVVLKRYLDKSGIKVSADNTVIYADNDKTADYAREAVEYLSSGGIMESRENNMWCPTEYATRAETAKALYNAIVIQKEQAEALGRYGDISQYDLPHEVITDDRLAEMMPTPFDAKIWPQKEIAYDDLEDDDFGILNRGYWSPNAQLSAEDGYNSNGCIKVNGTGQAVLNWKTAPGEVQPGDYIALSAMVKGENINVKGSGYYTSILAVSNENNVWLNEAHEHRYKADTDWVEVQQILMIPEGVNALSQPDFYNININLYVGEMDGTVYFDEVRLSKIKFAPMDTVLMEPVYKGVIKGEGGIGDISLRAYVNELNGMYDFDNMKFTAQITDENNKVYMKSETDTVTSAMDVHFSSASLPMGGDYWIESILTDKTTGEVVQTQEWGLHKREADFQTIVDIDKYGRILRNGEPYFPISVYHYGVSEDMEVIAEVECIDNIQASANNWVFTFGNDEAERNRIKKLEDNNKTISLATGNMAFSNIYSGKIQQRVSKQEDIRGLLTKLVNNHKTLPNLFAYYIYDEQNAMRYGEEEAWVRKIVESLDLDHPTTCAIDSTISFRKGIYAKTSDFLGYDPYPATGKANQDLSLVYDRITEAKQLNPNRPVYAILQMYWYSPRGDLRGPTKEEFRSMTFQAICAGSFMLDAYGWQDAVNNSPAPGRAKGDGWKDWGPILEEVQYLEPIILSVDPAPYYEVKGGGEWLNTMARRHDGKSYLFTVNNSGKDGSAIIYLDGVKKIKGMYSKKEYEADDNGYFEIEWEAYGTEVFEYEQSDYKSPHAELKNFAATNAVVADSESEVPSIIISGETNELEYNAHISDYASLYINEEKVETTGKLNLEGLSEIKIKIVSEDGRFSTEKTFMIKRS